jgi:rRNA maturation RNase YbeY
MAVKYYNDGTDFRLPGKGRAGEWLRRVVEEEGLRLGAVNLIFCSPERHLEINRQFLGHDYHTDVITFDYSGAAERKKEDKEGERGGERPETAPVLRISGDIFIDPETVADNAVLHLAAPEVEMRRVMVHGVLHLCGYGDKTPKEQRRMRAKEDFYLAKYYERI